jgi:dihydrolipoamide dehydrogenase
VYLRLGAQVSVVGIFRPNYSGMDASLSKKLTKVLKKQGEILCFTQSEIGRKKW